MQMKASKGSLASYINTLQTKGQYTFTRKEALKILGVSSNAFKLASSRLVKKQRLARPKKGFYVIVPTEYSEVSAPPATWFIDSLMKHYQQPYYVGLLSAAALHGAAHQQPQTFQVVTIKPLRPIEVGRSNIHFFTKKQISIDSYEKMKTFTGYMHVSIPEITAIDLVHYIKSTGYLNNVATVLTELQEKFSKERFLHILETEKLALPDVQRLGYLLELVNAQVEIILLLKHWLKKKKLRFIPLRSDKIYNNEQKNINWHIYVNEKIEADI